MSWWEHRETADGKAEMAETLEGRAKRDPDNADALMARAQMEALLAVYHQLRAIGDHQELLAHQQRQITARLDAHAKALDDHAGGMADHGAALASHSRGMADLAKAIRAHGDDVRDAIARWER